MSGPAPWAAMGLTALAATIVIAVAALQAWRDWIGLQRLAIDRRVDAAPPSPAARIELADLRERVRRLESIAAGVDP